MSCLAYAWSGLPTLPLDGRSLRLKAHKSPICRYFLDLDQPVQERQPHRRRRHGLQDRRVPARQARQGRRVRAHEAAPGLRRQRDRPHLPRRREVPLGAHRGAQDAVPLRRRHRRALHGHASPSSRSPSPEATFADALRWITPSSEVDVLFIDGEPADLQLPSAVELEVTETDPGLRGDTVSGGGTKPATLETGAVDPGAAVRRAGRAHPRRHAHRRLRRARLRCAAPISAGRRSSRSTSTTSPAAAGGDARARRLAVHARARARGGRPRARSSTR